MAERLSKVYGTQMDKIGACRYGDSCERIHNKPPISQTVLLEHMYENNAIQTALISGNIVKEDDAKKALEKYEHFFEEIFTQMMNYGEIEDMIVVDNLGDHIAGNVYVKYTEEEYAENAQKHINGRFKNGKKINAIFSPVTDFQNAKCKQYIDGSCKRGGYCNYMHVKPISKSFKRQLFEQMYTEHPQYRIKKKEQSSEDEFEMRRKQRRDRRNGKHKKHRERSRSKQQKKKKKKRGDSSESRNSSQDRRDVISKWNKEFYNHN